MCLPDIWRVAHAPKSPDPGLQAAGTGEIVAASGPADRGPDWPKRASKDLRGWTLRDYIICLDTNYIDVVRFLGSVLFFFCAL